MARILIVEDEQDLANLLVYNLKREGHEPEVARTGAAAIVKLQSFQPELVLLDLMLPDISGLEVIRAVKSAGERACPVMMVTAKGSESDRVQGFELGADDYVVKPFSVRELLLRVQAVLRRGEPAAAADAQPVVRGELTIDPARHEVTVAGKTVVLTALEFRLLQTLAERPGRIQTREALLADVWGIVADIETRTVDTHIKRLRQKLGDAGQRIETVRGVGYRLVDEPGAAE